MRLSDTTPDSNDINNDINEALAPNMSLTENHIQPTEDDSSHKAVDVILGQNPPRQNHPRQNPLLKNPRDKTTLDNPPPPEKTPLDKISPEKNPWTKKTRQTPPPPCTKPLGQNPWDKTARTKPPGQNRMDKTALKKPPDKTPRPPGFFLRTIPPGQTPPTG